MEVMHPSALPSRANRRWAPFLAGRKLVVVVSAVLLVALASEPNRVVAQEWPTKPLRILIGGAPGAGSDLLARVAFEPVGKALGTPIVIESRTGMGGSVALSAVAQAAPDGYTFGITTIAPHAISPAIYENLKYDPLKDFAGIARLATIPNVMVVNKDVPIKSVQELIGLARKNPGQLNFGLGGGYGTSYHAAISLLYNVTGIQMTNIAFKDTPQAVQAMMAGDLQVTISGVPSLSSLIRSGRVRAIGVTSIVRSNILPEVPTFAEAGLAGFDVSSWFGAVAPAGTPQGIIARMSAETIRNLARPETIAAMEKLGFEPAVMNARDFERFYTAEFEKWSRVAKATKMRAD